MGWVRLDDRITEHPKLDAVGPLGSWMHVCAIAFCNRQLTNGVVPIRMVMRLGSFDWDDAEVYLLPDKLVGLGLWHASGHQCEQCPPVAEGNYLVHGYCDYQPTREEVEERRAKDAERQRAYRERQARDADGRYVSRRDNTVSHNTPPLPMPPSDQHHPEGEPSRRDIDVTNTVSNGASHTGPNPTQPNPEIPKGISLLQPVEKTDFHDVYEALTTVCNIAPGSITSSAEGAYARSARDLADIGATPDEVMNRAMRFRNTWPDVTMTPTALARRWAEVGDSNADVLARFAAGDQ